MIRTRITILVYFGVFCCILAVFHQAVSYLVSEYKQKCLGKDNQNTTKYNEIHTGKKSSPEDVIDSRIHSPRFEDMGIL